MKPLFSEYCITTIYSTIDTTIDNLEKFSKIKIVLKIRPLNFKSQSLFAGDLI